jgi:hypothetical protein
MTDEPASSVGSRVGVQIGEDAQVVTGHASGISQSIVEEATTETASVFGLS